MRLNLLGQLGNRRQALLELRAKAGANLLGCFPAYRLAESVLSALLIEHHKIPPVAPGNRKTVLGQSRLKARPVIAPAVAIPDDFAGFLDRHAKAAGLLELRAFRLFGQPVRRPVARKLAKAKFNLKLAANLLHLADVKTGVDGLHLVGINPAPRHMHVRRAVFEKMQRYPTRLPVKTKRRLDPVGCLKPLLAAQALVGRQPHIGMKKRFLALRLALGNRLDIAKRCPQIRVGKAAHLDQLGLLAVLPLGDVGGEPSAMGVQIALRDHVKNASRNSARTRRNSSPVAS